MTESRLIFGEILYRLMHADQRAVREAFRAHAIEPSVARARVLDIQAAAGQRMAHGLADADVARFVAIADHMTAGLGNVANG